MVLVIVGVAIALGCVVVAVVVCLTQLAMLRARFAATHRSGR